MLSLLIVEMMLKCTEYLLIRLSCSVTGRINQSRGQLYAYIFQAHLRTSGYEITVLSSQIWSTNAVPLCHSNLRWRCYYVELSKVIKTVRRSLEKPGWTLLTAFIYWGGDVPFYWDYKSSLDLKKIRLYIHGWPPKHCISPTNIKILKAEATYIQCNTAGKSPLIKRAIFKVYKTVMWISMELFCQSVITIIIIIINWYKPMSKDKDTFIF